MLKKTITYTDFNGNQRTDDFYFNLTKAELAEMQTLENGGFDTYLLGLAKSNNVKEIMSILKDVILKSYGQKSDDGRRFSKSEEISRSFLETEAYSELFIEIASNEEKATEFILGILPESIRNDVENKISQSN